ncbi:MAG TPA: helical backbone metal receptor [Oligoflexia bacterium]|nr:helical backbone metal receptor [Oligoflexia bacterium]HMR24706.1 helical backbone metal receptor [Oligoflexia bacterium]
MVELQQYNGETLLLLEIPKKIVSLVPSVTETLIEWGKSPVARTQFCIYPKEKVKDIPHVKGTKNPDIEKIIQLSPDLIIANKEENRQQDIEHLKRHCPVWITYPEDIKSMLYYLEDLAKIVENKNKTDQDIKNVRQYFTVLQKKDKNKIACFIWKKPWMVAAGKTYISSLIESYCSNAFGHVERYPHIELSEIKKNSVDHIFLLTEPFCFNDTHRQELKVYFNEQGIDMPVSILNGENFTWPGPRSIEAIEEMKRVLN